MNKTVELETLQTLLSESPELISETDLKELYEVAYEKGLKEGKKVKKTENKVKLTEKAKKSIPWVFSVIGALFLIWLPYRFIYIANCKIYEDYELAVEEARKGNYDVYEKAFWKCKFEWFGHLENKNDCNDRQERLTKAYENSEAYRNRSLLSE